jgi:hypothetical protein
MIKWILTFLIILLTVFINGTPFIFGDGYGYYHSAKSLSTEGTFTTATEPDYFEYTGHAVFRDERGQYSTIYPVGNSLFWLPGLSISKVFNNSLESTDYYTTFNGHSIYDGISILLTASVVLFLSMILVFKTLRRAGFSQKNAFVSIILVYLAQYIFSYLWYYPSYSHIYELFSFSLLLYLFQRVVSNDEHVYEFLFGVSIGLLTLTRVVDVVLAVPFILYLVYDKRFKTLLFTIAGGIPTAIIFFYYNTIVYGSPLSLGYSNDRGGQLSFENFNLFNLLFSDVRGLLIWSPLILVSIAGLVWGVRKLKLLFILTSISAVLLLGVYTFWPNWWGGDSLGQRFFIVLAPVFILGLSNVISILRSKNNKGLRYLGYILILSLVTFSIVVQILYRITPVKKLHSDDINLGEISILKEERFTSFDILNYHIKAIQKDGISIGYAKTIFNSFNGGRSLLLLAIGQTDPLVKATATSTSMEILVLPNTKGILPKDLRIEIKYLDTYYYISNIPEGIETINIICLENECISDEVKVSKDVMDTDGYTDINEIFGIDTESASRVNLINTKIGR